MTENREKIAKYQMALYCKNKGWEVDNWDDLPDDVHQKYLIEADGILSLFDEQEIRKDEREKIAEEIRLNCYLVWSKVAGKYRENICVKKEWLEALKEM